MQTYLEMHSAPSVRSTRVLKTLLLGCVAIFAAVCVFQSGALQGVVGTSHSALRGAGANVDANQVQDAMWTLQHVIREAIDNGKLKEEDDRMMKGVAQLVEQSLEKVTHDEATMQAFTTQMQQILQRAHELIHDPALYKLLRAAQLAEEKAPTRRLNSAAFVPASAPRVSATRTGPAAMFGNEDLKTLATELNPVVGYWDPLNLAEADLWNQGDEATIGFLRHAEIKHGRVAMAAFVGYIVQANGIHFPWKLTGEISYEDISNAGGPQEQWDALPTGAKLQIILFVGFLELLSENSFVLQASGEQHYMRGGKPGRFPSLKAPGVLPHPIPLELWDPIGLQKKQSPEKSAASLRAEINNGRLAMLGIMAFLAESKVPGSVPALTSLGLKPYAGDVMAPFSAGDAGNLPFVQDMFNLNIDGFIGDVGGQIGR